jgi:hypothetical protein
MDPSYVISSQCFPNRYKSEFRILRLSSDSVSVNLPLRADIESLAEIGPTRPPRGNVDSPSQNNSSLMKRTSFCRSAYVCLALSNTNLLRHRDPHATPTIQYYGVVECGSSDDRRIHLPIWVTSTAILSGRSRNACGGGGGALLGAQNVA